MSYTAGINPFATSNYTPGPIVGECRYDAGTNKMKSWRAVG